MAKRHKEWARRMRSLVFDILGRSCVQCHATTKLTFDCKEPRGDEHHKYDTERRMRFYLRELKSDNLQVLCHKCNSSKKAKEDEANPF